MNIKCEKNTLINNINLVQRAIANKTTLPILECVLLTVKDGKFKMIATDMELIIKTADIECDTAEEGKIALPCRFFSEIIRKMPDGIISIETGENFVTVIKCRSTKFSIVGQNGDEFPTIENIPKVNEYRINGQVFKNMINKTAMSICKDETKTNLVGALIEINMSDINMVTCDTFRVSYIHHQNVVNNGVESIKSIIPAKTVTELERLIGDADDMAFYISSKHVLFDIGSCTVGSRLIEGAPPPHENIFPENFELKVTMKRQSLSDAVERAEVVITQEKKNSHVMLDISGSVMTVTTVTELGDSVEEIDIEALGGELTIAFNPKFLADTLRVIDEEDITIEFNTKLSPCVIKPLENGMSKFLILPVRIRN